MKSIKQRMLEAEQICERKGVKLTPLRRILLEVIYQQKTPMTAYELLRELKKAHSGAEAMTVYRVLNFLESQHLIHRIISHNTYTPCDNPSESHHAQLLSCEQCGRTEEIAEVSLTNLIVKILKENDFMVSSKPTELFGICSHCQGQIKQKGL